MTRTCGDAYSEGALASIDERLSQLEIDADVIGYEFDSMGEHLNDMTTEAFATRLVVVEERIQRLLDDHRFVIYLAGREDEDNGLLDD